MGWILDLGRWTLHPALPGAIREFKISQRGRGRERLETIHFNYIV